VVGGTSSDFDVQPKLIFLKSEQADPKNVQIYGYFPLFLK